MKSIRKQYGNPDFFFHCKNLIRSSGKNEILAWKTCKSRGIFRSRYSVVILSVKLGGHGLESYDNFNFLKVEFFEVEGWEKSMDFSQILYKSEFFEKGHFRYKFREIQVLSQVVHNCR